MPHLLGAMTRAFRERLEAIIGDVRRVEDEITVTRLHGLREEKACVKSALGALVDELPEERVDRQIVEAGLCRKLRLLEEREAMLLEHRRIVERILRFAHGSEGEIE